MIQKDLLEDLYVQRSLSSAAIAQHLKCSPGKVNYWLSAHAIKKRSISAAIYAKWNPNGDPFQVRFPKTISEAILYGIGLGLYWGEGTKSNRTSVRLGNTNPELIKTFVVFLKEFYGIHPQKLRFGLQVFGDMDAQSALRFWIRFLHVSKSQFYPTIVVTPHRGVGNYRKKTKHGVLTVYFNNRKLRDIICNAVDSIGTRSFKPM